MGTKRKRIRSKKRKRIRSKKRKRIRSKKRKRIRSSTSGGADTAVGVNLMYGSTSIANNQDLTGLENLYAQEPQITLVNTKPTKNYLVIMIDPDAPAGTWTHYVALFGKNNSEPKVFYPYEKPNPPPSSQHQPHHYIIKVFEVAENLSLGPNEEGNRYYANSLLPVIQNKKIINKEMQFIVNA